MKKKGFTLVELLAVIIVLAIIALIAVSTIAGVIDKARKGAFKASVLGLMESVDLYQATNSVKYDSNNQVIFNCDGEKCQTEEDEKLSFKGEVPISGQIILQKDGTVEAYYLKSDEYCALGERTNLDVQKDCTKLDITVPEITLSKTTLSTNEIIIYIKAIDIESGIKEIEYSINDKKEIENYDNIATVEKNKSFDNLESSKEYTIVVTVTNGNDKKASKEITLSTLEMGATTVKLINTPSSTQNGYLKSQTATLEYSGSTIESPYYYVKTTREAMATATTTSCGMGTVPGTCSSITSTTTLEADTWYRYINIPTITYDKESDTIGTIYAAVGDGVNLTATATGTVSKIDIAGPSVPTVTYNGGSNTCTWKNNYNLTLASSDSGSGIDHYEIDWDNDGASNATTGANFVPWNGFHSHTVRFRAVDKLGNVSGWTSEHHIHMDTQAPTHTNWWWGEVTKNVARLYIQVSDNVGVPGGMSYDGHNAGVFCPTSTASGGYGNWVWFQGVWDSGANAYRCDITPPTFGHYNQTYVTHLYIWDYAGNGGYYNATSVGIPASRVTLTGLTGGRYDETGLCSYIADYGTTGKTFSYNGYTNCTFNSYSCDMNCDDMGWAGWYGWGNFEWNDAGWWDIWAPANCSGSMTCDA